MLRAASTVCRLGAQAALTDAANAFYRTAASATTTWSVASCSSSGRSYAGGPHLETNPEPSARVLAIVESIENLTVKEMVWLNSLIQERFGVTDAELGMGAMPMGMGMAMPAAAAPADADGDAAAEAPKEEKSEFKVEIESFEAAAKIKVIKEVRTVLPDLGLKEAKELVEKLPATIKSGISKDDAAELEKKLSAVGAKIKVS